MADIALVYLRTGISRTVLRLLHFMRPVTRPFRRFRQTFDVLPQPIVFGQLIVVLTLFIFPPIGKIALLNLNVRLVDGQDTIYGAIQKSTVVRYKNKPALAV
ncbi:hypothetical protein D3C81_1085260 [compost metagenome]